MDSFANRTKKVKTMIKEQLMIAEQSATQNIRINVQRLVAIRSIRKLLDQIDFSSEVVPVDDKEKLTKLLVSLKGSELDHDEKALLEEIA